MKEITVRLDQSSNENESTSMGKSDPILSSSGSNNKRGYDVSGAVEPTNESENKRRKI